MVQKFDVDAEFHRSIKREKKPKREKKVHGELKVYFSSLFLQKHDSQEIFTKNKG